MVKVHKKDLEALIGKLESGGTEDIIENAMQQLAEYGLGIAKKNTPVGDTGELRRNWDVKEASAERIVLTNNTEYAEYVEYGHRQEPGRYVPKLGKRLKHSWVRGQFYAARSEQQLRKNAERFLKPRITKGLEDLLNG